MLPLGGKAPVAGNGLGLGLSYNSPQYDQEYPYYLITPANNDHNVKTAVAQGTIEKPVKLPQSAAQMPPAGMAQTLGVIANPKYSGLEADLSMATSATVNQLRMAIALQQMYELDARGGTRYIEIIKNHFGVQSSDARLQRAEYLGGKNIPIQISQVIQTSETASESPQGNTAGMSLTFDQDEYFTKSFEEHGTILILGAIKQEQSYQQGLPKMFSRFKRTDFYDPIFANIGEQPIYNREIYAQGTDVDEEVFGYQEAWADYRYKPNQVSGEFRSNDENTLDFWHLANDFSSLPTLGEDFIKETTDNLDRALTVPSTTQDQFIADFYFDAVAVRPMPPHSIPGLKRL